MLIYIYFVWNILNYIYVHLPKQIPPVEYKFVSFRDETDDVELYYSYESYLYEYKSGVILLIGRKHR
jgi:hypothetical protein